jgi:hypothetical protein
MKVQNVSSFPITFNNNIIFELSPIHLPIGHFGQIQGMDHKYKGHLWCKVKISNIKNGFGLGLKNPWCLGHLCCLNNFCEHFLHSNVHNEIIQSGDSTHIPLAGHFAPSPHVYTIVCKFCDAFFFCVNSYPCQMYYVIHKLQLLSRATIRLGMHEHPIA